MALQDPNLVDEVLEAFRRHRSVLLRAAAPNWLRMELTCYQLKVLLFLYYRGCTTVGQLACIFGYSKTLATHYVEQTVQRGLVGRVVDGADRRRKLLTLTPPGAALVESLYLGDACSLEARLAQLRPDDLLALHAGLRALIRCLETHEE